MAIQQSLQMIIILPVLLSHITVTMNLTWFLLCVYHCVIVVKPVYWTRQISSNGTNLCRVIHWFHRWFELFRSLSIQRDVYRVFLGPRTTSDSLASRAWLQVRIVLSPRERMTSTAHAVSLRTQTLCMLYSRRCFLLKATSCLKPHIALNCELPG